MTQEEHEAAVAAFIHARGITRCPTACAGRTQGSVAEADRLALRRRDDAIEAKARAPSPDRVAPLRHPRPAPRCVPHTPGIMPPA